MDVPDHRRIIEEGPSLGVYRERTIPSYLRYADGSRREFVGIAVIDAEGGVELAQLAANECVIAPGLIYRAKETTNAI